jgi:hypothetical protein
MKMKLAVAFAVLLFASLAQADSLTDPNGTILFPDGSVITSDTYVPSTYENGYDGYTEISFQFQDGNGEVINLSQSGQGYFGGIGFTVPVTDLTITWDGNYLNAGGPNGEVGNAYCAASYPATCTTSFSGVVSGISWDTQVFEPGVGFLDGNGSSGISSLSYTLDPEDQPSVPEPSSLLLTGMGLIALVGFQRRK